MFKTCIYCKQLVEGEHPCVPRVHTKEYDLYIINTMNINVNIDPQKGTINLNNKHKDA